MANYFMPADILLPANCDMECWAVIACDQFTSDKAYWERVRQRTEGVPSTMHMILPEAELSDADDARFSRIHLTMRDYLDADIFHVYPASYVYVERTLKNGAIRQGIVGMLDLEYYDYDPAMHPKICATEDTVLSRVPPRVAIRKNAELEFPHVLLLCEDEKQRLIEQVASIKQELPMLYDFELMEGGGRIRGWLLHGDAAKRFDEALLSYEMCNVYMVGDGNHSLVTAKKCYERLKTSGLDVELHPARYALVELENIHSPAMVFEPIHRVITETNPAELLKDIQSICSADGVYVPWFAGNNQGALHISVPEGKLLVGVLQDFLDAWLAEHPGQLDYVHDTEAATTFTKEQGAIAFLLPAMPKNTLFPCVQGGRTLPRKAFSMGHGSEKRYYLEGRKIK